MSSNPDIFTYKNSTLRTAQYGFKPVLEKESKMEVPIDVTIDLQETTSNGPLTSAQSCESANYRSVRQGYGTTSSPRRTMTRKGKEREVIPPLDGKSSTFPEEVSLGHSAYEETIYKVQKVSISYSDLPAKLNKKLKPKRNFKPMFRIITTRSISKKQRDKALSKKQNTNKARSEQGKKRYNLRH
ncbi:hypothetical protein K501DRAFT_266296 [Backusella circina FSU 941]|nr:hypothetical protein K501DRAFT_266296 [Backusella circina FSU 941]